ncbi:hypothetical protein MXD95_017685, partial [Frankia sp. AiPa1]
MRGDICRRSDLVSSRHAADTPRSAAGRSPGTPAVGPAAPDQTTKTPGRSGGGGGGRGGAGGGAPPPPPPGRRGPPPPPL